MAASLLAALKGIVPAIAVGVGGGAVFALIGLPAPWMSGALVAVAIASFAGLTIAFPAPLRTATFLLMGAAMGSAVTPETLRLMAAWPVSMAALALLVPATMAGIALYLARIEKWDRESAFYASVPGAMSYVMALALSSRADTRAVVVVQSFRLVLLVAALPSAIVLAGLSGSRPVAAAAAGAWFEAPVLLAAAAIVGVAFERFNVPGGATVGAMLASAALHATGLITVGVPPFLITAGFVLIGVLIAERFAGTTLGELRRLLRAAVGAFLVGVAVTLVFAAVVAAITGVSMGKLVLAYAPGGIEAMAVLAFLLDLDPAFVGAHHLVRFVGIAMLLPLVARWTLRPEPPP